MKERELSEIEIEEQILEKELERYYIVQRIASILLMLEDIGDQKGEPTHQVIYGEQENN